MDPIAVQNIDEKYMRVALEEARMAGDCGDVPVGAILVRRETGEILARGHNTREICKTVLGHAEINAISEASSSIGDWRLSDCTLYVTLEPCPMCTGAILHARIPRVVYGAADPIAGAMGSVWALHEHPVKNAHTHVERGCMEQECIDILRNFFQKRRAQDDADGQRE